MKYVIDCFIPVDDRVLDPASFEKFLHDRIKVNGKAGQLGDVITITREKVRVFSPLHLEYPAYKPRDACFSLTSPCFAAVGN